MPINGVGRDGDFVPIKGFGGDADFVPINGVGRDGDFVPIKGFGRPARTRQSPPGRPGAARGGPERLGGTTRNA